MFPLLYYLVTPSLVNLLVLPSQKGKYQRIREFLRMDLVKGFIGTLVILIAAFDMCLSQRGRANEKKEMCEMLRKEVEESLEMKRQEEEEGSKDIKKMQSSQPEPLDITGQEIKPHYSPLANYSAEPDNAKRTGTHKKPKIPKRRLKPTLSVSLEAIDGVPIVKGMVPDSPEKRISDKRPQKSKKQHVSKGSTLPIAPVSAHPDDLWNDNESGEVQHENESDSFEPEMESDEPDYFEEQGGRKKPKIPKRRLKPTLSVSIEAVDGVPVVDGMLQANSENNKGYEKRNHLQRSKKRKYSKGPSLPSKSVFVDPDDLLREEGTKQTDYSDEETYKKPKIPKRRLRPTLSVSIEAVDGVPVADGMLQANSENNKGYEKTNTLQRSKKRKYSKGPSLPITSVFLDPDDVLREAGTKQTDYSEEDTFKKAKIPKRRLKPMEAVDGVPVKDGIIEDNTEEDYSESEEYELSFVPLFPGYIDNNNNSKKNFDNETKAAWLDLINSVKPGYYNYYLKNQSGNSERNDFESSEDGAYSNEASMHTEGWPKSREESLYPKRAHKTGLNVPEMFESQELDRNSESEENSSDEDQYVEMEPNETNEAMIFRKSNMVPSGRRDFKGYVPDVETFLPSKDFESYSWGAGSEGSSSQKGRFAVKKPKKSHKKGKKSKKKHKKKKSHKNSKSHDKSQKSTAEEKRGKLKNKTKEN